MHRTQSREEYISLINAGDDKDTIMDLKVGRQKSSPKLVFIQCQIYNLCGTRHYSEAMENDSPVKGHSTKAQWERDLVQLQVFFPCLTRFAALLQLAL